MKFIYFVLITSLLLPVLTATAQDQIPSIDVPTLKSHKPTEPFLGIAVNIPLWKVFGRKSNKVLPKQPIADSLKLIQPREVQPQVAKLTTFNLEEDNLLSSKQQLKEEQLGEALSRTPFSLYNGEPPLLNSRQCYEVFEVTTYTDGSQTRESLGIWCETEDTKVENRSGGGGGTKRKTSKANICELAYLAEMSFEGRDPVYAAACMLLNEQSVKNRIKNRFEVFSDTDSEPLNAVKHAMFIAFNACDFGSFDAGNLATLHEDCGGIPRDRAQSAAMDLFNNNVGLNIQAQVGCANMDNLADAVFDAFLNGQLRRIDGQPTP